MKNKVIVFLSMIMLVAGTVFGAVKPVDVHFISTGNSDSILIADNGKFALIDGADNDDEQSLVDYLTKQGVKELEYLILTHPDADHCGGLDAVVKNFAIKQVFVGNGDADSKTYKDFINACMAKKLQPSVPLADKTFKLGNGSFKFYNQKANNTDVNDNSLVALYTNGTTKYLFMGDAGVDVEKALPLKEIGKVNVLKVGHHGSKTSSSDAFIKAVAPKYAIICCGSNNKYGHPHQEVTSILNKYKATTFRTDLNGTVIITSDGTNISSKASKQASTQPVSNTTQTITPAKKDVNTPAQTKSSKEVVYVTKSGKKYHTEDCSSLSKSKIEINKEDAEAKGYTPCSKCNP